MNSVINANLNGSLVPTVSQKGKNANGLLSITPLEPQTVKLKTVDVLDAVTGHNIGGNYTEGIQRVFSAMLNRPVFPAEFPVVGAQCSYALKHQFPKLKDVVIWSEEFFEACKRSITGRLQYDNFRDILLKYMATEELDVAPIKLSDFTIANYQKLLAKVNTLKFPNRYF